MRAPTPVLQRNWVRGSSDDGTGCAEKRSLERSIRRIIEQTRFRLDRKLNSYIFLRSDELVRQRRQMLDEIRSRMEQSGTNLIQGRKQRLEKSHRALTLLSPQNRLQQQTVRLQNLRQRLGRTGTIQTEKARNIFAALAGKLHSLSPVAVLARGYAVTWKLPEQQLVHDASQLKTGDQISLWLGQAAQAEVKTYRPNRRNYEL